HSDTSPFWVSNQRTSTSTLYAVTDKTTVTKVNVNPAGFVAIPTTEPPAPQGPTGQVNNTNPDSFPVAHDDGTDGTFARFIFANLNGTISAWDGLPAGNALTAFVQNSGADGTVYTGLAINRAQTRLTPPIPRSAASMSSTAISPPSISARTHLSIPRCRL